MSKQQFEEELAAMDRGFKKLMARPNGARLFLYEIGAIDDPTPPAKKPVKRKATVATKASKPAATKAGNTRKKRQHVS